MLAWMQHRRRYRSSNRFCAWNGYDLNFDFSNRTSLCDGLRIYYDPYAQNYVTKTGSKSNCSWRHSKYCCYGNCRNLISIVDTRVYAFSTNRCIILDRTRNNTTCWFCSSISSHVLGYETRRAASKELRSSIIHKHQNRQDFFLRESDYSN